MSWYHSCWRTCLVQIGALFRGYLKKSYISGAPYFIPKKYLKQPYGGFKYFLCSPVLGEDSYSIFFKWVETTSWIRYINISTFGSSTDAKPQLDDEVSPVSCILKEIPVLPQSWKWEMGPSNPPILVSFHLGWFSTEPWFWEKGPKDHWTLKGLPILRTLTLLNTII